MKKTPVAAGAFWKRTLIVVYHRKRGNVMQAKVLVNTLDMSREEWLEARKKGIGGSDVAAIAGLIPKYKTAMHVYLEKTGQVEKADLQSEAAYWGSKQEPLVAEEFSLRTGLKVKRRNAILQHPEYPWMLANVDRIIVGKREGLECKTTNEFLKDEWSDEQIPAPYILQCQHYMAVTGYEKWWIAVLIGGNKFKYKPIERDEEIIRYLIDMEKDFWLNHVEKNIPPAFDGSEASSNLLSKLYPVGNENETVELPEDAKSLIEIYEEAKAAEKEILERKKEAENKLKALLGEAEIGIALDRTVSWKTVYSSRLDSKALAKEYPDIYNKYVKQTVSRRFAIK
jgi:putative phage-type endonuclease